jgi:hypothetical protein
MDAATPPVDAIGAKAPATPARSAMVLPSICGLLIVAFLAFLHLPYPFDYDQGLFAYGAKAIAGGARLYIDFWDIKQPGIYWYFAAAGSLFGFDEVGIHTFDLIWIVVLALVLQRIALRAFPSTLVAVLTPAICLGPFYAKADAFHITQVELVVALPLAAIMWLLLDSGQDGRRWRFAAAGALAIVVMLFKLMLFPIPAAMIALVLLRDRGVERVPRRELIRSYLLPALLGAAAVLAVLIACLWHLGILGASVWTSLVYPRLAIAEYGAAPFEHFLNALDWFWTAERFLLPFALIATWREIVVRRSALGMLSLAWLAVGIVMVLAQVLSWWQYHFDLFFVPMGLLAAAGVQQLADLARRHRYGAWAAPVACVLLLGLTTAVSALHKVQRFWLAGPSPFQDPIGFMSRVEPNFASVTEAIAFLDRADARPGLIANLGDPRIFLYARRPAVMSVNASAYMLTQQVEQAAETLEHDRPVYVYLGAKARVSWAHGSDAIEKLIARDYVLRLEGFRNGRWYELNDRANGGPPAQHIGATVERELPERSSERFAWDH